MRLLIVTRRFDLIGGSERYAGAVARGLAERGHEVTVLCAEGEQDAGVARVVVPALAADRPSRADRAAIRDAAIRNTTTGSAGATAGARPDALYVLSSLAGGALDALREVAPVVRHVQDHTLFCPGLNKVREDGANCREPLGARCLERYWNGPGCSGFKPVGAPALRRPVAELGARLADLERHKRLAALVCASDYMRDQLVLAGCDPTRVHRVPYFTRSGTDEVAPAPLEPALDDFLATDDTTVFCPARLTLPDKGVDYLLTALAAARAAGNATLRCVIAGEGPARAWLERKARDEGLADGVRFVGWQSPGAVESLYARCDLVAFPSVWDEPFGLVGLEAAAHARPVVAFAVGGVVDWLEHERTGLAVPNRDAHAFARALERLATDPDLARRLGDAAGERTVARFTRHAHLDRLEAVLSAATGVAPVA